MSRGGAKFRPARSAFEGLLSQPRRGREQRNCSIDYLCVEEARARFNAISATKV